MTSKLTLKDMTIHGSMKENYEKILNEDSLSFISKLHNRFNNRRLELLAARQEKQAEIDRGVKPDFLPETASIRNDPTWKVAETPPDIQKRWVEITGPTDRKMVINALNSGADVFMADFEDANSPTWDNLIEGQLNLIDAIERTIQFESPEGKQYSLNEETSVLFVRPRGWHLEEKHITINGQPISGSLFDFGLYFFHNGKRLLEKGTGPYFYLAKLENHLEARLWNDVFVFAQEELGIPVGSIRATVLVETILAVFQIEEILYELREHSGGCNAGRWDYIFSIIKKFRNDPQAMLPDRDQVTMTVPFMRAYTELLVRTCHKRGAHAIGGMAAFIPSRKDEEVNTRALRKVREDKLREVGDGFDGTWVAHPDLVVPARDVFADALQEAPHQKQRLREDVTVTAKQLIDFTIENGSITEDGLRHNINVGLQYLASWLRGTGAAAIYNLMEDAATAEICRAQVWQWLHGHAQLDDGRDITSELVEQLTDDEIEKIRDFYGSFFEESKIDEARKLFDQLTYSKDFFEFLTLIAYERLH